MEKQIYFSGHLTGPPKNANKTNAIINKPVK